MIRGSSKLIATASSALSIVFGCSSWLYDAAEPETTAAEARVPLDGSQAEIAEHVVLVAIDGVRGEDVFGHRDVAPAILALADRGVAIGVPGVGAPLLASGPNFVSLPGYSELLSGAASPCRDNDCTRAPDHSIIDFVCDASPHGEPCRAAVFSSWQSIERVTAHERGRALVSAGRAGGEAHGRIERSPELSEIYQRGVDADPSPGSGTYRPDAHTAELALAYLTAERPRFAFVSLGDTDEYAHADRFDAYRAALSRADDFIGRLTALLDSWTERGENAVLMVTVDHGRGHGREFLAHGGGIRGSENVWLVAAGPGIAARGNVALESPRHLRDVAPSIGALLDTPFIPAGSEPGAPIEELFFED